MVNPISSFFPPISSIPSVPGSEKNDTQTSGMDFSQVLGKALEGVDQAQKNSAELGNLLSTGKVDDLHTVMIEGERASLALQFTLQVRNKILDAYNEIMRMTV